MSIGNRTQDLHVFKKNKDVFHSTKSTSAKSISDNYQNILL